MAILVVLSIISVIIGGAAASGTTPVALSPYDGPAEPGTTIEYEIVVENATGGVGSVNATVATNDTSVVRIENISTRREATFTRSDVAADQATLAATGMDTLDSGPVTVATVTVVTDDPGYAALSLSVTALGDEEGRSYTVSETEGRVLAVREETTPTPDPGGGEDSTATGTPTPASDTGESSDTSDGDASVTPTTEVATPIATPTPTPTATPAPTAVSPTPTRRAPTTTPTQTETESTAGLQPELGQRGAVLLVLAVGVISVILAGLYFLRGRGS